MNDHFSPTTHEPFEQPPGLGVRRRKGLESPLSGRRLGRVEPVNRWAVPQSGDFTVFRHRSPKGRGANLARLRFRVLKCAWPALGVLVCLATALADPARLTIDVAHPRHSIAPSLWGIFLEDINHSVDGGIYPELVRNRSFEDAETPESWTLANAKGGKGKMGIDTNRPLNPFNRRSLRVELDRSISLENEGYWGMALVQGNRYRVRLSARAADGLKGPPTVQLRDRQGRNLAQGEITGIGDNWEDFTLELTASGIDPKARLSLSASGPGTLWLDMVSVMPRKTWKNHGLRPDLCEMLDALKPACATSSRATR